MINGERQWRRLMELAEFGAIPDNGVNRQALTALDRAARRQTIEWAQEIGAAVSIDEAANLWLRVEGSDPTAAPVLTGSHMDSQPKGGRFDGAYGVIAGLEAITALHEAGIVTKRPIEVVAWTNEEGGRFAPGCTGSMSWSGFKPVHEWDDVRDADGVFYGTALAAQLAAEADLPRRPLGGVVYAYVEAHIEQGPLLENEGLDIGVVTGIQGSRWFNVSIEGESAHAGTAPLSLRRDAMLDAVRAISALSEAMADPDDVLRFTVGRVSVSPNSSNSVADRVTFSIDLRHPDADILRTRGAAIAGIVQAAMTRCDARLTESFTAMPITFDPMVIDAVEQAAQAQGYSHRRLASGAFHDAQFASRVTPSGMIFVPSHKGISHNPAEYSSPSQLAAGTQVLLRTLMMLAAG
jgi:N-carbamoyl-L-amino-acid hydrolase